MANVQVTLTEAEAEALTRDRKALAEKADYVAKRQAEYASRGDAALTKTLLGLVKTKTNGASAVLADALASGMPEEKVKASYMAAYLAAGYTSRAARIRESGPVAVRVLGQHCEHHITLAIRKLQKAGKG